VKRYEYIYKHDEHGLNMMNEFKHREHKILDEVQ